ncbi:hypothetical protein BDW62DRAFT_88789 [Aspergillus aurantiobrunneus]
MYLVRPPDLRPLGESLSPRGFCFQSRNLCLDPYLKLFIPKDLQAAFHQCQYAASEALLCFRALDNRRQLRYQRMCPTDDVARLARHTNAINRLINWKKDYNPADPTLAPTPSLTREDMAGLRVSQAAYNEWAQAYNNDLLEYMEGPYEDYHRLKNQFAQDIKTAGQKGTLDPADLSQLSSFFHEGFLHEMSKWEGRVQQLAIPTYKELLDDVFWAIMDSVEDGEELFRGFHDTYAVA